MFLFFKFWIFNFICKLQVCMSGFSVAKSCLTLCHSMDCTLPCSSVHGISQVRILEWVAISFSRESSQLSDGTCISCIGRQILYPWATWEAQTPSMQTRKVQKSVSHSIMSNSLQPDERSLPGSSIRGIFQARILGWVAISFSRRSFWPRDWTQVSHIVGRSFTVWATREVCTLLLLLSLVSRVQLCATP